MAKEVPVIYVENLSISITYFVLQHNKSSMLNNVTHHAVFHIFTKLYSLIMEIICNCSVILEFSHLLRHLIIICGSKWYVSSKMFYSV